MFKRVMVAVVGIPFLLLVLIWAPEWCTLVLVAGMCAIGAWELMHAVRGERGASLANPMVWAPVLMALLVPVKLCGIHSRGDLLLFYLENPSEGMLENIPAVSQVGMDAMISTLLYKKFGNKQAVSLPWLLSNYRNKLG